MAGKGRPGPPPGQCPDCKGEKKVGVIIRRDCPNCGGTGKVSTRRTRKQQQQEGK